MEHKKIFNSEVNELQVVGDQIEDILIIGFKVG
jgi:hypothetical protein